MRSKSISFTVSLVALFTALLVISSTFIGAYNYHENAKNAYNMIDKNNYEIRKNLVETVVDYLLKTEADLKVLTKADLENDVISSYNMVSIIMWEQLMANDGLSSIFIADKDGNFLQARREPEYALRLIEKVGDKYVDTWEYKDENYQTKYMKIGLATYDARVRPWYKEASTPNKFTWSDPYIFASTGKVGITIAYPKIDDFDEKIKVVAVDISLGIISKFLEYQSKILGGDLVLFNESGTIIGASFDLEILKEAKQVLKLQDLPSLYQDSFKAISNGEKKVKLKDSSGKNIIFEYSHFPKEFPKNWYLATYIDEDKVVGELQASLQKTLTISSFIMLFFIFIIIYLAKGISKPIVDISSKIYALKDMNLDINLFQNSHIKEVGDVQESLIALRSGLSSFKRYIPADLVKQLIKQGIEAKVGGDEKNLAILFTDIEGFTTISETMKPEELMVHLSDYFDNLVKIINKNNGTVDKYIGDAILAFWGAPLDVEKPALLAVKSAIEMQKELITLNKNWVLSGKPKLHTRVGIHYGKTLVGNVGSQERLNYTIMGDSVNIASRLEGVNKSYGTSIIISEDVYEFIKDENIEVKYLDTIFLKGKTTPTKIYEVVTT